MTDVVWTDSTDQTPSYQGAIDHEKLWKAVLAQMLRDGKHHHRVLIKKSNPLQAPCNRKECEQAYDDLVNVGPMLRYICEQLDIVPLMVSDSFIAYCGIELD